MLKIGDFARIAQVSIRQLRHYDEIGLLKPIHVDPESGYRFYTIKQLPRLNRILALKDLGFTLAQIARALDDDVTGEEIRGMLSLRRAQIEQTLQNEITRMRRVEVRLNQIADEDGQWEQDVVIKQVPPVQLLSAREMIRDAASGRALLSEMVMTTHQHSGLGSFVILLPSLELQDENLCLEIGFLVEDIAHQKSLILPNNRQFTLRQLPEVETMATVLYVGDRPGWRVAYVALGKWIEANHYELLGPGRKIFYQFGTVANDHETVMEVQLPVQKMSIEINI